MVSARDSLGWCERPGCCRSVLPEHLVSQTADETHVESTR